ncbi:nuclear transport factor 2 family protein [Flammeovirga sp. OC4]|uniref:nuclear transport factor 2 family protein n=1 Tax=Flammeovirga sp. OC4 TaxID=1382345 RepID=UPI00069492A3|nr:nuclear transport factor 2 family protein [Flammeovirga sp. OC4]
MKKITVLLLISILSITANAQRIETINETVSKFFIATDNKEWGKVENIFALKVELDYSSMNGNPAVELSPKQITNSWKTILPGFTHTHHQIGNLITSVNGKTAQVFCYGTATHYLEDDAGNIWTVVGSYNFELKHLDNQWRISKMKFNYKYQDGNTNLPAKAIENVKQ